jgi:hypothetical protein
LRVSITRVASASPGALAWIVIGPEAAFACTRTMAASSKFVPSALRLVHRRLAPPVARHRADAAGCEGHVPVTRAIVLRPGLLAERFAVQVHLAVGHDAVELDADVPALDAPVVRHRQAAPAGVIEGGGLRSLGVGLLEAPAAVEVRHQSPLGAGVGSEYGQDQGKRQGCWTDGHHVAIVG